MTQTHTLLTLIPSPPPGATSCLPHGESSAGGMQVGGPVPTSGGCQNLPLKPLFLHFYKPMDLCSAFNIGPHHFCVLPFCPWTHSLVPLGLPGLSVIPILGQGVRPGVLQSIKAVFMGCRGQLTMEKCCELLAQGLFVFLYLCGLSGQ